MTVVKLVAKPKAAASGAIELRADWLYSHRGARVVGIVELAHNERTEPADDSEKDRSVSLQITGLELASADQEETLRQAMAGLYMIRTATGTLTEDGDVEIGRERLNRIGPNLNLTENVRLTAGVRLWADKARRAFQAHNLSPTELRHELEAVADGLQTLLLGLPEKDGDDD